MYFPKLLNLIFFLCCLYISTLPLQCVPDILIWVDILVSNEGNWNDIFEWIWGNSSRQSNLAQLVTDTVGRHSGGDESVPQVLSTYITVGHHHQCNVSMYRLFILSVWLCTACFTSMSCFFFSFSPLYYFFSLLDDKASPGAPEDDGKLSVGPVWLTLLLSASVFVPVSV